MKPTIKPGAILEAWHPEALFTKAQRYALKVSAPDLEDWEKALWSSLALELLARAALANVNPALLADTGDKNWQHLYSALGYPSTESKYLPKSIGTSDVFRRLTVIFAEFTEEHERFCVSHIGLRNAELHSGDPAFNGAAASSWQSKYYTSCKALLSTMCLEPKEFVDEDEAAVANKLIAAARDDSAKAVKGDVAAHAKVWEAKTQEERDSAMRAAMGWALRHIGHRIKCPSCSSVALVNGEPISPPRVKLEEHEIVETQEHLPSIFECVACGLKISGLSKLSVVGLGDRYKKTITYDAAEYYAQDQEWQGYEDDNNEPF